MTSTISNSGYAPVNGLELYYEIHGESREKNGEDDEGENGIRHEACGV